MKKYLFILSASILLVSGCKKEEEPQECDFPENPCCDLTNVSIEITDPSDNDTIVLGFDDFLHVEGNSTNVANQGPPKYIYLLVWPVDPFGGGWYIQETVATIDPSNGTWNIEAHIGAEDPWPVNDGDEINIAAIVVCDKNKMESLLQNNPPRVESTDELPPHKMSAFVTGLNINIEQK